MLRALFVHDAQRYNALLSSIEGISAKELTRNLRELQNAGLVMRQDEDGERRYQLTPLGHELLPTFRNLGMFGTMLAETRRDARRRL